MNGPATMKDALSVMIAGKTPRLRIVNESGECVGTLDLEDVLVSGETGRPRYE